VSCNEKKSWKIGEDYYGVILNNKAIQSDVNGWTII